VEYYDGPPPSVVKVRQVSDSGTAVDSEPYGFGPIIIFRRKKRFSKNKLRSIFKRSGGQCSCARNGGSFLTTAGRAGTLTTFLQTLVVEAELKRWKTFKLRALGAT